MASRLADTVTVSRGGPQRLRHDEHGVGTFIGHQRNRYLATSGDFPMARDNVQAACIREHLSVVRHMSSGTDDGGWEAFKCHTRPASQPARLRL